MRTDQGHFGRPSGQIRHKLGQVLAGTGLEEILVRLKQGRNGRSSNWGGCRSGSIRLLAGIGETERIPLPPRSGFSHAWGCLLAEGGRWAPAMGSAAPWVRPRGVSVRKEAPNRWGKCYPCALTGGFRPWRGKVERGCFGVKQFFWKGFSLSCSPTFYLGRIWGNRAWRVSRALLPTSLCGFPTQACFSPQEGLSSRERHGYE